MKFLWSVRGCTRLDQMRITEIWKDTNIFSIDQKICHYRNNWYFHINRMDEDRLPRKNEQLSRNRSHGLIREDDADACEITRIISCWCFLWKNLKSNIFTSLLIRKKFIGAPSLINAIKEFPIFFRNWDTRWNTV